jgi:DNA-binding response OmpR family regulator
MDTMDNTIKRSDGFPYSKIKIHKDGKSALVLGYKIELTKSEFTIVNALLYAEGTISRADFESKYGLTYSSVPVHISNINKKAFPITNRKLIDGCGREEYKISDTM